MPTIRNGRGELSVHDMSERPGTPSGPMERRLGPIAPAPDSPSLEIDPAGKTAGEVRRARLERDAAFAAASRARGAAAGGFVKGATKPAAAAPTEAKPKGPAKGFKRSPEVRERMRQGQLARYATARGEELAKPAHIVSTESPLEGREAGAPATDADEHGTTGAAPAAQVATPLGLPEPVSESEKHSDAPPDPPQPSPAVLLPCEGCIHAIVCSIKPELEAWAKTLLAPVSPLAAISIGAISVSCVYERAEP